MKLKLIIFPLAKKVGGGGGGEYKSHHVRPSVQMSSKRNSALTVEPLLMKL